MIRVTFEDHGQDFLEWYLMNSTIVDCQPCQGVYWVGQKIEYSVLQKGDRIRVTGLGLLKYPIERIEVLSDDEAVVIERYYAAWQDIQQRVFA